MRFAGRLALDIVQSGDIAIVSLISPYQAIREKTKQQFNKNQFILVHISTPLNVCEERDIKGLYKQSRVGKISQFSGISDPYDIPSTPDVSIDTSVISINDGMLAIINYIWLNNLENPLIKQGVLGSSPR